MKESRHIQALQDADACIALSPDFVKGYFRRGMQEGACVLVFVCVCVYECLYVRVCVYECLYLCMRVYVHVYVCVYSHVRVCLCI